MKTTSQKAKETKPKKVQWKPETVGRTYEITCYTVVARRIGGDGTWYGRDNFQTLEDAQAALKTALAGSGRFQAVGGLTVDFGPDTGERYERKLVKVVKCCEVLQVGEGPE